MDNFLERLIVKEKTFSEKMEQWLIVVLAVLISYTILYFMVIYSAQSVYIAFAGPLLVAAIGYFSYKLIIGKNIEYEIIITNEFFDLDKIIGKSKRKKVVATDIRLFNAFNRYDKKMNKDKFKTKIYAYNRGDKDLYFVDVRLKELGDTLIVFSADEEMLSAIKLHLSYEVRKNAFSRN